MLPGHNFNVINLTISKEDTLFLFCGLMGDSKGAVGGQRPAQWMQVWQKKQAA